MDIEPLSDTLHPRAPATTVQIAANQEESARRMDSRGTLEAGENRPVDHENWFRVLASREGLIGGTTASGRKIEKDSIFVTLPARKALGLKVEVFYKGKTLKAPVWDVGPWNTKDAY